jgi:hypothetical protein
MSGFFSSTCLGVSTGFWVVAGGGGFDAWAGAVLGAGCGAGSCAALGFAGSLAAGVAAGCVGAGFLAGGWETCCVWDFACPGDAVGIMKTTSRTGHAVCRKLTFFPCWLNIEFFMGDSMRKVANLQEF